jgi:hypothetical protein
MAAISQRACIECRHFDRETKRSEERTLVRCFEERNKDGIWNRLVRAGQPACKHFVAHHQPTAQENPAA